MADCPDIVFIGLSATPWTRGLGKYYDDLIFAATTKDLIEQGYLSRFTVFAPLQPDLSDVGTVAGDFHEGQLAEAVDKPALVGDVIETWLAEPKPVRRFATASIAPTLSICSSGSSRLDSVRGYIDCFTDQARARAHLRSVPRGRDPSNLQRRYVVGGRRSADGVLHRGCAADQVGDPLRSNDWARPPHVAEARIICSILDHSRNHSAAWSGHRHPPRPARRRRTAQTGHRGQGTSETAPAAVPGLLGRPTAIGAGLPRMREGPRSPDRDRAS